MDEVDFTILAATSVLGDLIEKCPPAEACRDAFDRMSKATVQMCMSTTGFGSSATGLNSRRRSHSHGQQHESHGGNSQTSGSNDYFHPNNASKPNRPATSRPKPTFDMSLNDLLGQPATTGISTPRPQPPFRSNSQSNSAGTPGGVKMEFTSPLQTTSTLRQTNTQSVQSPSTSSPYAVSPPLSNLDTSAIDPSLLPSPQAQGQAFAQAVQATYAHNPYQEMQFPLQGAPGMDFLLSLIHI